MNCAYHSETENVAFCIRCGRALCKECVHHVRGSVYCESCLAEIVQGRTAQTAGQTVAGSSPGAAFALGLIPGVGAIYNGEFFKAAVHLVIFGLLIALKDAAPRPLEGFFGLLTFGFYMYMPFEAYYTAKKKKLAAQGIELETPVDRLHQQLGTIHNKEVWGGFFLVTVGSLFLLSNFGIFRMAWFTRFWPLILIVLGVWLLQRYSGKAT